MKNITLRSRAGADGNLHLNIPTALPNTELDVVIWLNPANTSENNESPETFSEWQAKKLASVPHRDDDSERDLRFEYLAEHYQYQFHCLAFNFQYFLYCFQNDN